VICSTRGKLTGLETELMNLNEVIFSNVWKRAMPDDLHFSKPWKTLTNGLPSPGHGTASHIKTHNAADQLTLERIQTSVTNWTTIDYTYNNNGGLDTVLPANEASTSYGYDYAENGSANEF